MLSASSDIPSNTTNMQSKHYSIVFFGFNDLENKLIDSAVKLSQRIQNPSLTRVSTDDISRADIVMIDSRYLDEVPAVLHDKVVLRDKVVIRVDAPSSEFAHDHLQRPLHWFKLPSLITKALDRKANPEKALQSFEQPTRQAGQRKILVVDDSETTRNHLASLIQKKGYLTYTAASVSEAIAFFDNLKFHCVFMDVIMPDVDGYEGCKLIKKMNTRDHATPVVMLTSKSSPFDKVRGKMAGCDAYLTKPTTLSKLYATLDKVCLPG